MENHTNTDHNKVLEILKNHKNKSNSELKFAMDFIYNDFEQTKNLILKLVKHLDGTEKSYNKLLEEFNNRINGK